MKGVKNAPIVAFVKAWKRELDRWCEVYDQELVFKSNQVEESQSAELDFARKSTEGRIVLAHYEFIYYVINGDLSCTTDQCPFPVKEGRGDQDDRLSLTLKLTFFLSCKYL